MEWRHRQRGGWRTVAGSLLAAGVAAAAPSAYATTAKVVAIDQTIVYNRLGVFQPAGMIFALAQDVFPLGTPPQNEVYQESCAVVSCTPGLVQIRSTKRPRPLVLRVNAGDELEIQFTNLLSPGPITDANNEPAGVMVANLQSEQPATRTAGLHVAGLQPANSITDDASNVGANPNSLAAPGENRVYRYRAVKEGGFVITSGPNMGGEAFIGSIASGLFGAVNVEPAGTEWYRSQITREEMVLAADANGNGALDASETTPDGQPILNYAARYPAGHPYAGQPILAITDGNEIVHSDLNAVISGSGLSGIQGELPNPVYPNRGEPFREFTVMFHDEIKAVQAFPGWFLDQQQGFQFTLSSVKDGFAINYGTGGIGAEIIANRLGVGPMLDCPECKYEEFFLSSWTVGDPAMIVDVPANAGLEQCTPTGQNCAAVGAKATKVFYPEDPSNVWHSYMNDRVKFRNLHVGSEHHIFHLHAHQWLFAPRDDNSNYLDAQAIGPGASFTYEIGWGSGNRNKTPGDSIFHCHFYPHFAQGMWGMWRTHDAFEMGSLLDTDPNSPNFGAVLERGLVDGEIAGGGYDAAGNPVAGGTPTPGVVPLPTKGMAPMPGSFVADTNDDNVPDTPFMGYPFYIPGVPGHRPPTPPLDLVADGGLPRHVITAGSVHAVQTPLNFEKELLTATGVQIPEDGTAAEKAAMAFHGPQATGGGILHSTYSPTGAPAGFEVNGLPPAPGAPFAEPCRSDGTAYFGVPAGTLIGNPRQYNASVIELDTDLNKIGWHFNQQRIIVLDEDVDDTLAGARAPEPFVMRANTNDCINYNHTNRVPHTYQLDDFQVKTPTDVIGQHIHLVKFDVTSADGSGNGWNYEDGTFSPDEIAERIQALTASAGADPACPTCSGSWTGAALGEPGVRTTRQRWYADPILNNQGVDRTLGNVFTHDHFGPSTHQQGGLYATLLIEPEGSTYRDPETGIAMGSRPDGGPTSWRADIIPPNSDKSYREFYLEFADFQLAYRDAALLDPVNPPGRVEIGLPYVVERGCPPPFPVEGPCPEAVSAADPGTVVVNYRNEPIAARVHDPATNKQAPGIAGDLAYAYASAVTRANPLLNTPPGAWPYSANGAPPSGSASIGAQTGDPFTPILRAYEGDPVQIRVNVGAHEETHNFNIHGIKWLQSYGSPNSGFRNSQTMGISEYFKMEVPRIAGVNRTMDFEDYLYETSSSVDARWNGSWGFLRAYGEQQNDLLPLPNNPQLLSAPVTPCAGPRRRYDVVAVEAKDVLPGGTLEYNPAPLHDPTALMYVMADDLDANGKLKANRRVEPLVLRARAGDCVEVNLTNRLSAGLHGPDPSFPNDTVDLAGFNLLPMIVKHFNANQIRPSSEVGLHPQLVDYDMDQYDGMNVGFNPKSTAAPGETVQYLWYAGKVETPFGARRRMFTPMEYGAINLSPADPIKQSSKGLVAAMVVLPADAQWVEDVDEEGKLMRTSATVTYEKGKKSFKDFVVIVQDDINLRFGDGSPVPIVAQEEESEDSGMKAVNYRTDPVWLRLGIGPTANAQVTRLVDFTNAFSGDPITPIFHATRGQQVRFRVLKPGGHNRAHSFALHGHVWPRHPYNQDSSKIDPNADLTFWHGAQMGHGPTNHVDVIPLNGAGGANQVPGDYLWRDMSPLNAYNGLWGVLRVE